MKLICILKLKYFHFTVFLLFFVPVISYSIDSCPSSAVGCIQFLERGLEIRYIVLTNDSDKNKDSILIDDKKYPLFSNKQVAIETISKSQEKKDYVVVYVVSDTEKPNEIINLAQ